MGNPWFITHKDNIRKVFLILFIISLIGPWQFERTNVPAEYPCDIRLYGDFCGHPISGIFTILMNIPFFFYSLWELITMTLPYYGRLLSGLSLLIIFPIFTTAFILWKKETRRTRTINLIAWILAFFATLLLFILLINYQQTNYQVIRLWGIWLYLLLAVSAIIFEITLPKRESDSS